MSKQSCKTCKFLNVRPDALGRIVVRAANTYQCTAPLPMPPLPESVTKAWGFEWPPRKRNVTGKDGQQCPTWEKR